MEISVSFCVYFALVSVLIRLQLECTVSCASYSGKQHVVPLRIFGRQSIGIRGDTRSCREIYLNVFTCVHFEYFTNGKFIFFDQQCWPTIFFYLQVLNLKFGRYLNFFLFNFKLYGFLFFLKTLFIFLINKCGRRGCYSSNKPGAVTSYI